MSETIDEQWMINAQNEMRQQIDHTRVLTNVRYVAGADLTVEGDLMVGCLVVIDVNDIENPVYTKCSVVHTDVPYVPGLLCFREGPVVLQLIDEFKQANIGINIDLLIVDGNGEWHMRGFGLASYVGIKCGIPTCGVSKTYLYVGNNLHSREVQDKVQPMLKNKGDYMKLEHTLEDGFKIKCAVMRTTESSPFNPIYVSCGHLCTLESIINVIKGLCKFREPEPVRLADRISRKFVKDQLHKQGH